MYFVYMMESEKDHKLYIGSTDDLTGSFAAHNRNKVEATKGRRPFKMLYYEIFLKKENAQQREERLKKFWQSVPRSCEH